MIERGVGSMKSSNARTVLVSTRPPNLSTRWSISRKVGHDLGVRILSAGQMLRAIKAEFMFRVEDIAGTAKGRRYRRDPQND